MRLIELDNIDVSFGGLRALNGVSFGLDQGGIVGLVGPNGAGKTTMFDVLSGFVRPTTGRLRYDGVDITHLAPHKRARRGIGRTFQTPQPLHGLTVRENVAIGTHFAGRLDHAEAAPEIDDILDMVGLADKQHANAVSDLSLTEKKALEVAKALSCRARLLLLDEVMAGLTVVDKRAFAETIRRVNRKYGVCILMIEHDIETISTLCPRVVVLNFGRLIADAAPDAVFSDREVMESYTGE